MEPALETWTAAGLPRRVARWRPGARPRLLALHGFSGSGVDWAPLAARIPGDWAAPDLAGHAGSPSSDPSHYPFSAQAADVGALRRALGWERPLLLGYSFGGRLALGALVAEPSAWAGAVLIGATAGIRDPAARTRRLADDRVRAATIRHLGTERFLASWRRRPLLATQARIAPAAQTRMAAARSLHRPEGLADSLRGAGTGSMPPLWDQLGGVTTPVLLLSGAEDSKFQTLARDLAAALPSARCVTISDAGHCAHLEAPEASAAAILEFVETLECP